MSELATCKLVKDTDGLKEFCMREAIECTLVTRYLLALLMIDYTFMDSCY